MKKRFIKWIFITGISVGTPTIAAGVMAGYAWIARNAPAAAALIDPVQLVTLTVGIVSGLGAWLISRWLGVPVGEIQQWLADKGLYAGRPTGIIGERTAAGLEMAINSQQITVKRAQLVPGKVSASGKF